MIYSIIVPCFNVGKYIPAGLLSCLKQSVDAKNTESKNELELILINDGSNDDTREKIIEILRNNKDENLKNAYSQNIQQVLLITQKNGGLSSARNTGIEFIKNTILRDFFECVFEKYKDSNLSLESNAGQDFNIKAQFNSQDLYNLQNEAQKYFSNDSYLHDFCEKFKLDINYVNENKDNFLRLIKHCKIINNDEFYKEIELDFNNILDFISQDMPNDNVIHFFDSDDVMHDDCMKICSDNMQKYNLDVFWHGYYAFMDGANPSTFMDKKCGFPLNVLLHLQNATLSEPLSGIDLLAFYNAFEMADLEKIHLSWAWRGVFRAKILNLNKQYLRFEFAIEAEDIVFGNLLILYAQKIKVIFQALIYYRVRATSISGVSNTGDDSHVIDSKLPFYIKEIRQYFKTATSAKKYYWEYCHLRAAHTLWQILQTDTNIKFKFITWTTRNIIIHIIKTMIKLGFDSMRYKNDPLNARGYYYGMEFLFATLPLYYRARLKVPLLVERVYLQLQFRFFKYWDKFIRFLKIILKHIARYIKFSIKLLLKILRRIKRIFS